MDNEILKNDYHSIIDFLNENGYIQPILPNNLKIIKSEGELFSIAYPIQGLLKYHGLSNKYHRTAYFPSISLNNDVVFTITYLKFSKNLKSDKFIFNGKEILEKTREFQRVVHQLNFIRSYANFSTKAIIISKNLMKDTNDIAIGKGLGTSASGGAAIAHCAVEILYENTINNQQKNMLKSIFSRYLAGSGSRSSVGGIGLWLNYPNIDPMKSYSLRLDKESNKSFINSIDLITISIPANIKTEQAHDIAPLSPFFEEWLKLRKNQIIDFISGLIENNFNKIGNLTENDTLNLHSITMTAPIEKSLIVWEPDTIKIMHLVRKLRNLGIPIYFSIDTGPSAVLLTQSTYSQKIIKELTNINPNFSISIGKIAGPSKTIDPNTKEANLLFEDLQRYNK